MGEQSSVPGTSELWTACHIDLNRYSLDEECRYFYVYVDGECLDGHLFDDEWTEFCGEELRIVDGVSY